MKRLPVYGIDSKPIGDAVIVQTVRVVAGQQ